jgi:hypothetical protein
MDFFNDSVNRKYNKHALPKAQRNAESASDTDENVLGLELAIFHETNMALRPAQVYANLKGTQKEKVLWFDSRHPHSLFAEMLDCRGMQEAMT